MSLQSLTTILSKIQDASSQDKADTKEIIKLLKQHDSNYSPKMEKIPLEEQHKAITECFLLYCKAYNVTFFSKDVVKFCKEVGINAAEENVAKPAGSPT